MIQDDNNHNADDDDIDDDDDDVLAISNLQFAFSLPNDSSSFSLCVTFLQMKPILLRPSPLKETHAWPFTNFISEPSVILFFVL